MLNPRHLIAPLWLAGWRAALRLRPPSRSAFRILLFHDVPPSERKAFARLVRRLRDTGRLIDPAGAEARLAEQTFAAAPGDHPCLISFDDGFASNLEVARTILDPLGVKALFFVCPTLTGLDAAAQQTAIAANVFDGKRGAGDLRILGWEGVEKLKAAGHTIGSHTASHKRLTTLDPAQMAEEVEGAAQAFQTRLGEIPLWFAYTFGDALSIDAPSLAAIARLHRYCRSGVRGFNAAATHRLALRADHVDLAAPPAWQDLAVEGGLDPLYRKARARIDALAAGL